MTWPHTLLVLLLAGLGFLGKAEAEGPEFPLRLGTLRPASPLNPGVLSCAVPSDPLELALWRITTEAGRADHSCGNTFLSYLRTPGTPEQPGAFDVTAQQIREARSEVLLTTMEWQAGDGHPGGVFARAVRDLYGRVRADPAAYPQGMTVRIALGGFPDFKRPDAATQALELVRDLVQLGVPMSDNQVGWRLGVANYRYFPHSHVKLHVIDGQDLTVAGYNYTDLHLPSSFPGGLDLVDLGLRLRGPVAQDGVAVFDDLWRKSRQVRCPEGTRAEDVPAVCTLQEPDTPEHPDAARTLIPAGTARTFLLYRRPGFDQGERAHLALFGAAQQRIDVMQNAFSPTLMCWFAYWQPDSCPVSDWPPYLQALLEAMERGVQVRALVVDYGIDRVPNRSGVALLRLEARRRGIEDRFEARYVTFAMHTKAVTVDDRLVLAGSMNFHFSSWGSLGLNEAALATTDSEAVAQQREIFETTWDEQSRPIPQEWWLRNIVPGQRR